MMTIWAGEARGRSSGGDPPELGRFEAVFLRDAVDRLGLLREPTVLDVALFHEGGGTDCIRVPIIVEPDHPQWSESPVFSVGIAIDMFFPFQKMYEVEAASMFVLRMVPWIGPLRLRSEIGYGGALEK